MKNSYPYELNHETIYGHVLSTCTLKRPFHQQENQIIFTSQCMLNLPQPRPACRAGYTMYNMLVPKSLHQSNSFVKRWKRRCPFSKPCARAMQYWSNWNWKVCDANAKVGVSCAGASRNRCDYLSIFVSESSSFASSRMVPLLDEDAACSSAKVTLFLFVGPNLRDESPVVDDSPIVEDSPTSEISFKSLFSFAF